MRAILVLPTIAGAAACLAACASVDTAAVVQRIVRPEIGVATTREVGEPLFETIVARTTDGLQIAPGSRVKTAPGMVIEPTSGFTAAHPPFFCGPADQVADLVGPTRRPLAGACLSEKQLQDQHVAYQRGPVTRADPANFQQQLLYEGKVGTVLHLSYRELRGDLARPAFSQELSFDLADGMVVGAKGARIEVLKATNVEISFRVVAPFSP